MFGEDLASGREATRAASPYPCRRRSGRTPNAATPASKSARLPGSGMERTY